MNPRTYRYDVSSVRLIPGGGVELTMWRLAAASRTVVGDEGPISILMRDMPHDEALELARHRATVLLTIDLAP